MNQVDLFWDKYWAGYLGYLFLLVVPDHVLELIMVWVLDHVLKFFFFFFLALAQVPHLSLPTFGLCNTMQLHILVVAQKNFFLKEIEDFIKHSCRAKEYRRIDKDSRDHRMPFYRGLLRRKKKKKLNKVHDKKKRKYKE